MSAVWIAPLVAGGAGAVALVVAAAALRREVGRLQRSLRPLRVRPGRARPPRSL